MPYRNVAQSKTTFILGDLDINSWDKEYTRRVLCEELWVLANPQAPTHRPGTVDDAILVAIGDYIPGGILPGEAEAEK